ncbi:MAG: type I-F CRISPR-associated endoribonuclease Cas6/Csy4, partial [Pseudomonadales bacterium]|nr:type I-F CRISPR-associated endoribonuclease Cas6/Csy4 [Pseudomonadales bacterium]
MKYYQELTLIAQAEVSVYVIWSKLYTQLHLAFVEQKDTHNKTPYGVSFPQYRLDANKGFGYLGSKVRIFANTTQELEQLNLGKWLERLTDYVHITSARETPLSKVTGHTIYSRAVPKDSLDKRIAHQAQRRNISLEESAAHFKDHCYTTTLAEPFISLKSLSGQHL